MIEKNFLHVYEGLCFEELKAAGNPNELANIQRRIAAQLYVAQHSNLRDESREVASGLLQKRLKQYNQTMEKNMDNIKNGVAAFCSNFPNNDSSKRWSLKDLRSKPIFHKLETDGKKRAAETNNTMADLDMAMELILNLVDNKPPVAPVQTNYFSKLKSFEPELKQNPPKPLYTQQITNRFVPPSAVQAPAYHQQQQPERKPSPVHQHAPERKPVFQPPVKREPDPTEPARANGNNNNNGFRTAKDQLIIEQNKKKTGGGGGGNNNAPAAYGGGPNNGRTRTLGIPARRGLNAPFVLPMKDKKGNENEGDDNMDVGNSNNDADKFTDERLKNIEPKMVELIENEIMDHGSPVSWDDIAGLEFAKKTIKEIVVWPMLRPDIFTGLRGPPKGILLFGPPGTGKTLIGKCIASQSQSTFFSISASSLTSKWVGEGEKMVRALFAVARVRQPAVIFIDEIDSLLSQRSESEHESSRKIKTEFLVQLDGATTSQDDRLLVVGATNRPQELDEAARRRLVKRLYIPLPETLARRQVIELQMAKQHHTLSDNEIDDICHRTDGYSCADMTNLCREAAMGPIRSISFEEIEHIQVDQVRPIQSQDFDAAITQVRASVSTQDLALYESWNAQYGSGAK